jgi:hypothetical protein
MALMFKLTDTEDSGLCMLTMKARDIGRQKQKAGEELLRLF